MRSETLQDYINIAKPYSTLKLPKGIYKGNIIIDKPLEILGKERGVIIQGDKNGTVITIKSSDVILKNLTIKDSGSRVYNIDSAIKIDNAKRVTIDNCKIKDTLYGIDMSMVNDSNITNNFITSNGKEIPFRGHALRLYYCSNNRFINNTIKKTKDIKADYSNSNIFKSNTFIENRFATHLSFSHSNIIMKNTYKYNSVSIMLMGAKDTNITKNQILSSKGSAGIGVMIGSVSNLKFIENRVKFNAKGIYIEGAEKGKGVKRYIIDNEISYNKEAIHFHHTIKDNHITYNRIFGNIDDIVKDLPSKFNLHANIIEYNYWDRYEGFDKNGDNIGDTPHRVYQYFDRLWEYNHKVKFFYATPIISIINFISKVAPFIEPNLLFEDSKPVLDVK